MAHSLRSLRAADVARIGEILRACRPVFSDAECRTAVSMIREGLARPSDEDPYQFVVAESGGRVAGYACFGSVPLTQGAYDLYWIAVAPEDRGRGVGRALVAHVVEHVRSQGGRLIVAETSGRADYEPARRFYEEVVRWERCGTISDFYRPGDDKQTYVRRIDGDGEPPR